MQVGEGLSKKLGNRGDPEEIGRVATDVSLKVVCAARAGSYEENAKRGGREVLFEASGDKIVVVGREFGLNDVSVFRASVEFEKKADDERIFLEFSVSIRAERKTILVEGMPKRGVFGDPGKQFVIRVLAGSDKEPDMD